MPRTLAATETPASTGSCGHWHPVEDEGRSIEIHTLFIYLSLHRNKAQTKLRFQTADIL